MTYHSTEFGLPGSLSAELRGETAILRLSRAKKRNAIDRAMAEGIDRLFTELPQSIRAVVIHGEGDHFSAGVDLSAIVEIDAPTALFGSRSFHRVLEEVEQCTVPVIAVLHGAVIGCGLELAAGSAYSCGRARRLLWAARGDPRHLCWRWRCLPSLWRN